MADGVSMKPITCPLNSEGGFLKKLADQIKKEGEQQKQASQRAKSKSKRKY